MQVIPNRKADLNDFYSKGVTLCHLNRVFYEKLRSAMSELNWVSDPEGHYSCVPDFVASAREDLMNSTENGVTDGTMEWDYDRKKTVENCPDIFKNILRDILVSPHFEEWGFGYDFHVVFMDMWDGAEDCPWHWDGTDDSDIIMLTYLNDEPHWDPSWGGQLKVGQRNLTSKGLFVDFSEVTNVITVEPQRRTMALVNNRNPRLVHQPNRLNGDYERKVFTAGIRLTQKAKFGTAPIVTF